MGYLGQSWLMNFETGMQHISDTSFLSTIAEGMWVDPLIRVRPTDKGKDILTWVIAQASLENTGKSSDIKFSSMVTRQMSIEPEFLSSGLELNRQQLEDSDGDGFSLASDWAAQMGAQIAYYKQKATAAAILAGETGLTYDGLSFFNASHLVNPADTTKGTFSNLITTNVDFSTATYEAMFAELQRINGVIATIKQPNGLDPRRLVPAGILAPPNLANRFSALLDTKYIAASGTTGGGSFDISGQMTKLGYGNVVRADEFAADTTSFYLWMKQIDSSQIGAFIYGDREQPRIQYYTGVGGGGPTEAALDRMNKFEWHCRGRAVVQYGHPYLFFKIKKA